MLWVSECYRLSVLAKRLFCRYFINPRMIPELFSFFSYPTLVILDLQVEIKRNHQQNELRRHFYRYPRKISTLACSFCKEGRVSAARGFSCSSVSNSSTPLKSQDLPFTLFDFISASHGLFMPFYTGNFLYRIEGIERGWGESRLKRVRAL